MSDTDEIRAALSDALRLPGEVQARPGAAMAIRSRARSRRRNAVVAVAVAVPACLVVALLVTNGSSPTSTSIPATKGTPTPSRLSTSAPSPSGTSQEDAIAIAAGPRRLATPIEIRPVLREYLACPAHGQTVPAIDGTTCYRLGPATIVIRRVRDMSVNLQQLGSVTASERYSLDLRLTAHDTATFSTLTAASLNKQIALVVHGVVWTAPSVQGHITEGRIQISSDFATARARVAQLTG